MDLLQFLDNKDIVFFIDDFLKTTNLHDVRSALLYFYSTVAQSMAALFAVSGIFAIFRLQSIDCKMSEGTRAFREWNHVRLSSLNVPQMHRNKLQAYFADQGEMILRLGGSFEPHSWLEKDVFDHSKYLYEKARKTQSSLLTALTDYHEYFRYLTLMRRVAKSFFLPPVLIMVAILNNSLLRLAVLAHEDLSLNLVKMASNVVGVLVWIKLLLLYLVLYIGVITFCFYKVRNFNNPMTNVQKNS